MSPAERRKHIKQVVGDQPENFDAGALQWIANGPIADPERIYLPAGKLTPAQAKAREAAQLKAAREL